MGRQNHNSLIEGFFGAFSWLTLSIGRARCFASAGVAARVSIEMHVHSGVPHGFELFAPGADISRRAIADRIRVLRAF